MLNKPISYKFIPALATMLCACAPAQALNFHFGVDFPIGRPVVRPVCPVYPIYPVPVYVAPRVVRPCYAVTDSLIHEIQHDLNGMHADLHHVYLDGDRDLTCISRTIKNSWSSWACGYRAAFGISRHELEAISDELREIRFDLRRLRNSARQLCPYEYSQLRNALIDLANVVGSCHRYRTSDLRDVTLYVSQIRRILAAA